MLDVMLRRLARDQWVRLHGTPRVTVLVGGSHGREIWNQWIALSGMAGTLVEETADRAREGTDGAPESSPERVFDEQVRAAVTRAVHEPAHPIAVLVTPEVASRWRSGRRDRLSAMVDEGWIAVPEPLAHDARGPRADPPRGDESELASPGERKDEDGDAANRPRYDAPDADAAAESAPPLEAGEPARARFYLDARSVAEATLFEALEATPATAGRFRLNESLSVRFGPAAAEIDLLSRRDRIAIEIDGMHHFADVVCYRRDRRKDVLLQIQGFVVVRLLAEDVVRDVRSAVVAINQVLAYRLAEGRG